MTAIEFNNISKQYRLGLVSSGTIRADLQRWWTMNIRGKEDPFLKVGETNDRASKGNSEFVWALKDIDFKVEQGDVVGIIGKNGAGKSTLLKILSKVTGPTTGTIKAKGRIGSLLEVGTGFHPEMTGRENIYLNGAILGMNKPEISRKLDEIVDFSGCERYIDTPVKRYSSGMMVRLGFAVAAHLDPEILVVDEVLAVGDAEFQKKAIGKMQDVSKGEGRTVLFVSHNMTAVRNLCKSGVVLENGRIVYNGTAESAIEKYLTSNSSQVDKTIDKRTDRVGDGRIKVKNILLKNNKGAEVSDVFVGEYLRLEFHLEVSDDVDLSKMIVACNLCNPYGDFTTIWVSDEMNADFSQMENGVFSLEIPSVNLRPNNYNLYFQISLDSTSPDDWCDSMYNAKQISVLNAPFFSNQVLLKEGRGTIPLVKAIFIPE